MDINDLYSQHQISIMRAGVTRRPEVRQAHRKRASHFADLILNERARVSVDLQWVNRTTTFDVSL